MKKNSKKLLHKSILNVDIDLQKRIFDSEGITPPDITDDMGRADDYETYPAEYEANGKHYERISDKQNPDTPVRPYYRVKSVVNKSHDPGYINRMMVGTATTGNIRMEWALARYGQIIPTNWSQIQMVQYMATYAPTDYLVADAQNLIIKEFLQKDFEWLFLLEHDVILPVDAFLRLNAHIRSEKNPIISGLYFTKSIPAEPMIYRGRGNSYYTKWKYGDYVYVDGVPTGCLLIHHSVLKEMWKDAEEYTYMGVKLKKIFITPRDMYFDPLSGSWNSTTGTSDLDWCTRIMQGNYLKKAGWDKHAKMKYPFLLDTNIYCKQIDENGITYPVEG